LSSEKSEIDKLRHVWDVMIYLRMVSLDLKEVRKNFQLNQFGEKEKIDDR